MLKKISVVMLPTNEKAYSEIILRENRLILQDKKSFKNDRKSNYTSHFHLYFLSDEDIEGNIWVYDSCEQKIKKWVYTKLINAKESCFKKIIATTNLSCIDHGYLPKPSQLFLEKYVESYNKGEQMKEVLVEYDEFTSNNGVNLNNGYHTSIKVNPKDNTITIKKPKESWNREEVIELLRRVNSLPYPCTNNELDKWIKQNL